MPLARKNGITAKRVRLKRALGLFEVTVYGVGVILGTGIYALIGKGAGVAGNTLWAAFVFGAIIAALTGLSYAELGTMYPKEAAEYVYAKKATRNKLLPFLIGWLVIFIEIIAASTVALGFGGYFYRLTGYGIASLTGLGLEILSGIVPIISAIGLVIILAFLNFYGIKESAKANIIFTSIEMFGLMMIIVLGINFFGSVNYLELPPLGFSGIFSAAILMFFAYLGFEEMVNISEETINPKKVIPKAIIISTVITTLIYILVSISAVSIVPWNVLAKSEAPLADVAGKALPGSSFLLSIIALFATGNTVLIMLIVGSRMIYGMAHERSSLPAFFARIHPKRKTPWIAILTSTIITIALISLGNIKLVAEITDFGAFLIFISVNISLIWLRYKEPFVYRVFKVPLNIGKFPVLPLIGTLFIIFMLTRFSWEIVLFCLVLIFIGFLVYLLLKRRHILKYVFI